MRNNYKLKKNDTHFKRRIKNWMKNKVEINQKQNF